MRTQARHGESITYPADNNTHPQTGTLIFLKTVLVRQLSIATLKYRGEHPSSANETTADQFFSAEQFEAYRELGFRIGEQMITDEELIEGEDLEATMSGIIPPEPPSHNPQSACG